MAWTDYDSEDYAGPLTPRKFRNYGPMDISPYAPAVNPNIATQPSINGGDFNEPSPISPRPIALSPRQPGGMGAHNPQADLLDQRTDIGEKLRAAYQPNPINFPRALLGALVSNRNPQLGNLITGDYQRQRAIQPLLSQQKALDDQIEMGRQYQNDTVSNAEKQAATGFYQAHANAITNPPMRPKEESWSVVPNMTGPNGELIEREQNSGQTRYANLPGGAKPLRQATEAAPHTVTVGDRVKQWNPKTNKFDIDVGPSPKSVAPDKPSPSDTTFDKANAAQVTKDLTTARGADFRMRSMQGSYKDATEKNDQQAMLNLLTNHIGMTLGLQKGARITKDILHEATASAPWLQSVAAKFDSNGYLSGVTLTKGQMDSMMNLGKQQRHTAWQQAHDSASQAGLTDKVQFPKDFVPEGETAPKTQGNTITLDDFLKEPH